jgi:hypothetical protein
MAVEFAKSQLWDNVYLMVIERRGIPLSVYMTRAECKKLLKLMKEEDFSVPISKA